MSIASPVGQALLGKHAGDMVVRRRPNGDLAVTVLSVTLPALIQRRAISAASLASARWAEASTAACRRASRVQEAAAVAWCGAAGPDRSASGRQFARLPHHLLHLGDVLLLQLDLLAGVLLQPHAFV